MLPVRLILSLKPYHFPSTPAHLINPRFFATKPPKPPKPPKPIKMGHHFSRHSSAHQSSGPSEAAIPTGDPEACRAEASRQAELRGQCFEESKKAWDRGGKLQTLSLSVCHQSSHQTHRQKESKRAFRKRQTTRPSNGKGQRRSIKSLCSNKQLLK